MASPVKVPAVSKFCRIEATPAMIPAPTSAGIMGTKIFANDFRTFLNLFGLLYFCLAAALF